MAKRTSRKNTKRQRVSKRRTTSSSKFRRAVMRLRSLKRNQQSQAIGMANDSFIRQMCSQIKKLRYKKLKGRNTKALKRHSKTLRKLVNSKTSISSKRKILSQRGGIFPLLTPILMAAAGPALGGLAGAVANKAING